MSLTERFDQQADEGPDEHPANCPCNTPKPKAPGHGRYSARRWLRISAAAAVAVALVAVAIPAIAAVTASTVTYFACVTNSTGAIKVVGKNTVCGNGKHKISWNNIGPRGPQGVPGPQGPPGAVKVYIDNSSGASLANKSETTVGTLPLPVGKFLVTAKVNAFIGSSNNGNDVVKCAMVDTDENVLDTTGVTLIPGRHHSAGYGMTLLGATALTFRGSVQVACFNGTGTGGAAVDFVVITAVPVTKVIQSFG